MIKVEDKDNDYVYMYSKDLRELQSIFDVVNVSLTTTYKGYPALVVRKEKK